jgi:3-hydroxyisobutyrate dehydrogenase
MLPLFEIMGKKSLLCGSYGTGQATKACNNMLLATTMIGVGEAFNLGKNLGLILKNYLKYCQLQLARVGL